MMMFVMTGAEYVVVTPLDMLTDDIVTLTGMVLPAANQTNEHGEKEGCSFLLTDQ